MSVTSTCLRGAALAVLALSACTPRDHRDEPAVITLPVAETSTSAPAAAPSAARPPAPAPMVREERVVAVDGREERWSLVWASPPELACVGDDWHTCGCFGKELGERGPLLLVRVRADGMEQRLDLGTITLPRWRLDPGDRARFPAKVDVSAVRDRPIVEVMTFGDYDHDGRATEIVIERGGDMCGFHDAVVAGVSRTRDELHVFSTADAPQIEIVLPHASDWETIKTGLPAEIVYIPCGFRGGWPTYEIIRMSRDARGLHARYRRYACNWVGGSHVRGKRLFDRPWTGKIDD